MSSKKWLISLVLGAAAMVLVICAFPRKGSPVRSAPDAPAQPPQAATANPEPAVQPSAQRPSPAVTETRPQLEHAVTAGTAEPLTVIRVRPAQVLATVNGKAITLQDLAAMPAAQAAAAQAMSPEMYDALLQRAINRELVVQTARAQNVELTEDQQKRLESIRSRMERRPEGVVQLTSSPERTEFELRDAAALFLQGELAAKAGLPSPYVTPELVQQYYQDHTADYGELPADDADRKEAWQRIDSEIRQKLAPVVQATHDEQMRRFLDGLKAQANIVMATPAQ